MRLKKRHGVQFASCMLACVLVDTMVPTTALATASKGADAVWGTQLTEQELAAPQVSPEQDTMLPDTPLPDGALPQVVEPLQQDTANPAQNTQEQAGQSLAVSPQADKVTIEGPKSVTAPKSMSQKVLVDGVLATEELYTFEWYELVISSGKLEWQTLASVRGVDVTGSSFDVDAVSLQVLGKEGDYYWQVTEKGESGRVLNPIITSGEETSEPMQTVSYSEDKTCAIITTEDETITVEPGQSKNGLTISSDGTKITMDNMTVDGSKNTKGWSPDAVQLIVPPKADGSNFDVVVDVVGTNTLTCKYLNRGGLNWGYGLFTGIEGNHEITFTSSTNNGKLISNGDTIGCSLSGTGEGSKVAYRMSGGLEMVCTSDQNAPVQSGAGAFVLAQADLTVEQASLTITANGVAGLAGYYGSTDMPRIVFGNE